MTTPRASISTSTPDLVFDLENWFCSLQEQRVNVLTLLEIVRSDRRRRIDLWPEIRREIDSHHRINLASALRTLSNDPAVQALAITHETTANSIMALVTRLDRMDASSEDWRDDVSELQILFTRQSAMEETQLVPQVRTILGVGPPVDLDLDLDLDRADGDLDLDVDADDDSAWDGFDVDTLVFRWVPTPPRLGAAERLSRWMRAHPSTCAAIALAAGMALALRSRDTASRR